MIEIINLHKTKKINLKRLIGNLKKILALLSAKSLDISIVLCDNKFITRINKKFFKKNNPTDVISFPLKDNFRNNYLGEVIVCVQEASLRAKEYNNTFDKELLLYLIHGILHLLGYEDTTKKQRARMEKKQSEIIAKLIRSGYTRN